ncbi:MAG: DUF4835 family protein [Bacteroidales bacterium]|nr:DUF4835 family protein [Bacteroidales bacterium]
MKKILLTILVVISSLTLLKAQEFLVNISVSAPTIEGTDRRVFEALQSALYEFMNNRKWTNANIKSLERIECTMMLTVRERVSSDEYKGTLNVVLQRPIYKTSYNSPQFNFIDENVQFRYLESQPLEFSDNTFSSNLTAVFAYYAYIMLGLDFDSFSLNGGDAFYNAAESIVNSAQNANERGWKAFDGTRNRYWLVENLRNPAYRVLHQFIYEYHRQGLDLMADNQDEGRANIATALSYLEQVKKSRSDLFFLQLIADAKRDEIINIFSKGSPQEKTKVANIMREVDPANASRYEKILTN